MIPPPGTYSLPAHRFCTSSPPPRPTRTSAAREAPLMDRASVHLAVIGSQAGDVSARLSDESPPDRENPPLYRRFVSTPSRIRTGDLLRERSVRGWVDGGQMAVKPSLYGDLEVG